MKKLLLILILLPLSLFAQQEEYTAFLEQAVQAAKDNNAKAFNTNLRYFATAMERDEITPGTLSLKNRELYTEALYQALANSDFELSEDLTRKGLEFTKYDLETNAKNQFNMGRFYADGKVIEQNYDKARYWYENAAERGDAGAMNNLGVMYDKAQGVPQDYSRAKYWFERAADKGDEVGMRNIGVFYRYGKGVKQDYVKAAVWFQKAADKGYARAFNDIGDLYYYGQGVSKDYKGAKWWYEKAADKGNTDGMVNIGLLYENGYGVNKDYKEAKRWYEKAADKGSGSGMRRLGRLYYYGLGVSEDDNQAKKWFEKAVEKDDSWAMYYMGEMYDYGYGVSIDWEKAFQWYKKAADKNVVDAVRRVGEFYLFGVGGVSKNKSKAIEYFEKAQKEGDEMATTYLQVLRDISNKKYYTVKQSSYGNRIFLNEVTLNLQQKDLPWLMTKKVGWGFNVQYSKQTGGGLQIFPTTSHEKRKEDEINFTNYSSSPIYTESEGTHSYSIGYKKENGYRGIGYTYITAYFENDDEVTIKVPLAVCWLPDKYYK